MISGALIFSVEERQKSNTRSARHSFARWDSRNENIWIGKRKESEERGWSSLPTMIPILLFHISNLKLFDYTRVLQNNLFSIGIRYFLKLNYESRFDVKGATR